MKKLATLLLLVLLICPFHLSYSASENATNENDEEKIVTWTIGKENLSDNEFLLTFKATIKEGWYLYSQHIEQMPPLPTSFHFGEGDDFIQVGKIEEMGKLILEKDEMFDQPIKKYARQVSFQLMVRIQKATTNIKGYIEYMTCDKSQCKPPAHHEFNFILENKSKKVVSNPVITPTITTTSSYETLTPKKYAQEDFVYTDKKIHVPIPDYMSVNHKLEQYSEDKFEQNEKIFAQSSDVMVAENVLKYLKKKDIPVTKKGAKASTKKAKEEDIVVDNNKTKKEKTTKLIAENNTTLAEATTQENNETAEAQNLLVNTETDPVNWSFKLEPTGNTGEFYMIFSGDIEKDWYVYAQNNIGNAPAPIQIHFEDNRGIEFSEKMIEEIATATDNSADPLFKKEASRISDKVVLKRKVRFYENVPVNGTIQYMASNGEQYTPVKTTEFAFNTDQSVNLQSTTDKASAWSWWWLAFGLITLFVIAYIFSAFNITSVFGEQKENK